MRILIDADGCPVVDAALAAAKRFSLECHIMCDAAHELVRDGAMTHKFTKGADSVDFELVNFAGRGDIVVTQDYGLASMCLARGARVIDQNGREYTEKNIDMLLFSRHVAREVRRAGGRLRGPSKRTREQDAAFYKGLVDIITGARQ